MNTTPFLLQNNGLTCINDMLEIYKKHTGDTKVVLDETKAMIIGQGDYYYSCNGLVMSYHQRVTFYQNIEQNILERNICFHEFTIFYELKTLTNFNETPASK